MEELVLDQNLWEAEELALSKRKEVERDREMAHKDGEMTTACCTVGGPQKLGAVAVLPALAFLACF